MQNIEITFSLQAVIYFKYASAGKNLFLEIKWEIIFQFYKYEYEMVGQVS